ncbi:MAG: hypothetical protein GC184_06485 [Rhizobiales bacterium]|nr:hypothetical protein [Hyphomicrobiales bacterium]
MSGYVFSRAINACLLILVLATVCVPTGAQARSRIETGNDLLAACRVLSEHSLNPQSPTPREALYCRKYIAGYFATLKYLHDEEDARRVLGSKVQDPYACVDIRSPQSYAQLATQIVRTGEWNPQLLDEPALALAQKTFGDNPPC